MPPGFIYFTLIHYFSYEFGSTAFAYFFLHLNICKFVFLY